MPKPPSQRRPSTRTPPSALQMSSHLMNTYARLPVEFSHAQGPWIWDRAGRRYLDAISGIAVCGLGHCHPRIREAVCDQASKLVHTSNLFHISLQESLGERICQLAAMDRVFFANSGAEANEAAIKLARLYAHARGIDNPSIVVMENGFHGRTLATLSATGNPKVQAGFEPLVQGFVRIPYNDIDAVAKVADNRTDVVAVLAEPIQGEAGIIIPSPGYIRDLQALCRKNGWLLMLDEVQTGVGRTGKLFAHQHDAVVPDVMTLAKALGNGIPIGACLAKGEAAEILGPGSHGSTFGGNPLSCRAATAVLDVIEEDDLVRRTEFLGQFLLQQLNELRLDFPRVVEARGRGLMLALELEIECQAMASIALQHGLLINVTGGRTIRLLPPLILTDAEASALVLRLRRALSSFFELH